jgi:hypothetical protein
VHHIVPWEKCREHAYENLIALCPNCHRRAGSGEIDRKALRIYKARLAASFGLAREVTYEAAQADPLVEGYQTEVLSESHGTPVQYEVRCEYPKFREDSSDLREMNVLEYATALQHVVAQRHALFEGPNTPVEETGGAFFESSYVIALLSEQLVSIRYSMFTYVAGAAHPNHGTRTVNYALEPLVPLSLGSLFDISPEFVQALSAMCIERLRHDLGEDANDEWLTQGAGPTLEHFESFNITDQGILITFDPYQVAAYAAGTQSVRLEWQALKNYVRPSKLARSILELSNSTASNPLMQRETRNGHFHTCGGQAWSCAARCCTPSSNWPSAGSCAKGTL